MPQTTHANCLWECFTCQSGEVQRTFFGRYMMFHVGHKVRKLACEHRIVFVLEKKSGKSREPRPS